MISAAGIISILVTFIWLDVSLHFDRPGIWLAPIAILFAMLATSELLGFFRAQGFKPVTWSVYVGTLAVLLSACAPILWKEYPADCPVGKFGWPLLGLALAVGLVFIGEMWRYTKPGGVTVHLALGVFAVGYVGLLMTFLVALRLQGDNHRGLAALLTMIIIVKVSDTGAYTVGRMIGRHKLAPLLSPGKTIEGAFGAIAFGCLISWLLFQVILPQMFGEPAKTSHLSSLAFGAIVSVAGMLGDLAESLLKRDAGQKDSSTWLPGLGGVLDVIDSILTAAPAAYVCWVTGLVKL